VPDLFVPTAATATATAATTATATAATAAVISKGDFAALPGISSWETEQLKDAYDAITTAEKWHEMATFSEPSFMMARGAWLNQVQSHMKLLDHHSGSSYGCMMRCMEYIACNGWDAYVAGYIREYEEKQARKRREEEEAAARRRADTEEDEINRRRFERWMANDIYPLNTYYS